MARTEIVRITCDICGAVIDVTMGGERSFAVDGQQYTIDLCQTHTAELDRVMAPFVEAGRSAGASRVSRPTTRRRSRRAGGGGSPGEIREWAREHGFPGVSGRGRVPGEIRAAWEAAHGGGDATASASGGEASGGARRGRRAGAPRKARGPRKAAARKAAPPEE